jgi:hypothetical protein
MPNPEKRATLRVNLPGLGGSLGECVLCGNTFAREILLGETVPIIGVAAFGDHDLPIHAKCLDELKKLDLSNWSNLPEGPLRRCYAESHGDNAKDSQ